MDAALILETTFLIDLEREHRRGEEGPAFRFLASHPNSSLYLTFTTVGELAAGLSLQHRARWENFIRPFRVLQSSEGVCWRYGELYRYLARNGSLIGANDLWIAATALESGHPLVTRNQRHFRRVPGLELGDYMSVE